MRLFRSEEHARNWSQSREFAILTLKQAAALARAWYVNKLRPDWRRQTPEEAEAIFAKLGLDMDFWRLR